MRVKEAGAFKILGEMAKWGNNSEDKQIQSINDEPVAGLDVFLSSCLLQKEGKMNQVCFHCCPCHSYVRSLDTAMLFNFKSIKTAPDMSIPTRGIEKHLGCRLPGLPPWMSASDEGKKNETL